MGRLDNQCAKILRFLKERGQQGAYNWELCRIALKYTGRISDLRQQRHHIVCIAEDPTRGLYRYRYHGKLRPDQSILFANRCYVEKLGVEEDPGKVKEASTDEAVCPSCGAPLVRDGQVNVPKCSADCGTRPFESDAKENE